jgi:hypothetical protein
MSTEMLLDELHEVQELQQELKRLRDLLDRRPALNSGLVEAYVKWTTEVYSSDLGGRSADQLLS